MPDALETVACGNDCEQYILTGGDARAVQQQRRMIVDACSMPHTQALDPEQVRWRFPRYVAPVAGASYYYDIDSQSDILEIQTPEAATPFQLAAAQDVIRWFFRDKLLGRVALGACGYVRNQSYLNSLKFAGSHLNVSINAHDLQGLRTALENEGAREAMLYFLSTSQVYGGIGMAFAPEWEVRSRVIVQDISNDCIHTKGVLQPGRDVPYLEVKELQTLHYTHYSAGWSRSAYQRALSAACVVIDAHLGCHHTADVLRILAKCGIMGRPAEGWYQVRKALSRAFGDNVHQSVPIGDRGWRHVELLELRQHLYDRLLTDNEKSIEWVEWTLQQLGDLRDALTQYPDKVTGPLWGLDAIVKYETIFRPFAEREGHDLATLWEFGPNAEPPTPALQDARNEMLGLNVLYHDFSIHHGLYEDIFDAYPEVARWHQVAQVRALWDDPLPPTRSRRRQKLMEIYAQVSKASKGALSPGFAGFNRIGLRVRANGQESLYMHDLPNVLASEVTVEDLALVRQFAGMVGVNADGFFA